jgi:hypothetical protein
MLELAKLWAVNVDASESMQQLCKEKSMQKAFGGLGHY